MPVKLSTTIQNISTLQNQTNAVLIKGFYEYLRSIGTSENYQNQNLKALINYAKFLGPDIDFYLIKKKDEVVSFLDTKIKDTGVDPDKKWIRTWNDYLQRLKYFFRWLYNEKERKDKDLDTILPSDWLTPEFVKIKEKRTNRISPYLETEIWEKDELLTIIKYEPYKRNKAILSLLWDLDARPHEVALLKIRHIRLREKYGEGEIPYEAKTGTGPILLTCSFPYVRDWLNEHPFKNEPNARLICNLHNGAPIHADAINTIMKHLQNRIIRLLETGEITNKQEREKIEFLLKSKKWNPYCIRHSAITADSDYLPEYALKKKVRWSMNSKQGSRYIKRRMGNELKNKILEYNGITTETSNKPKISVTNCPRCELVNAFENKYCSKCSYPLKPEAYEEIKANEEDRIKKLEEKYEKEMKQIKEDIENKLQQILSIIDPGKLS